MVTCLVLIGLIATGYVTYRLSKRTINHPFVSDQVISDKFSCRNNSQSQFIQHRSTEPALSRIPFLILFVLLVVLLTTINFLPNTVQLQWMPIIVVCAAIGLTGVTLHIAAGYLMPKVFRRPEYWGLMTVLFIMFLVSPLITKGPLASRGISGWSYPEFMRLLLLTMEIGVVTSAFFIIQRLVKRWGTNFDKFRSKKVSQLIGMSIMFAAFITLSIPSVGYAMDIASSIAVFSTTFSVGTEYLFRNDQALYLYWAAKKTLTDNKLDTLQIALDKLKSTNEKSTSQNIIDSQSAFKISTRDMSQTERELTFGEHSPELIVAEVNDLKRGVPILSSSEEMDTVRDSISTLGENAYDLVQELGVLEEDSFYYWLTEAKVAPLNELLKPLYSQIRLSKDLFGVDLIGVSEGMMRVIAQAREYTEFTFPILLIGESGSGRKLVAQAIHNRRGGGELFRSTLANLVTESSLGRLVYKILHSVKEHGRAGLLIEECDHLGIHEVNLLEAILRESNDKVSMYLSCSPESPFLLSNLEQELLESCGHLKIVVPPVRERPLDIVLLSAYFLDIESKRLRRNLPTVRVEAFREAMIASWKNNITQLRDEIRLTLLFEESDILSSFVAPTYEWQERSGKRSAEKRFTEKRATIWYHALQAALNECHGSNIEAASQLDISVVTFEELVKQAGVDSTPTNESHIV